MSRLLRVSADFVPPPFLPAVQTTALLPKVEKKPPLLRTAGQLEQLFGPQLASAKETAIISSSLTLATAARYCFSEKPVIFKIVTR